jgi:hypothetical protein
MPIYVDTDKKLFNGRRAGSSSAKAEEKMQKVVKKIIDKADGFTTTKSENAKGYAINLTVSKIEAVGLKTKCSLSGWIESYPPTVNKDGEKVAKMVSAGMTGNGTVNGTSGGAVLDCIEAIAGDLATKSLPIMRNDDASRR